MSRDDVNSHDCFQKYLLYNSHPAAQQCFSQRDSEMLSYHEFPFFNDEKIGYPVEMASSHVSGPPTEMAWKKFAEICLKRYVSVGRVVCVKKKTKKTKKGQILLLILHQF